MVGVPTWGKRPGWGGWSRGMPPEDIRAWPRGPRWPCTPRARKGPFLRSHRRSLLGLNIEDRPFQPASELGNVLLRVRILIPPHWARPPFLRSDLGLCFISPRQDFDVDCSAQRRLSGGSHSYGGESPRLSPRSSVGKLSKSDEQLSSLDRDSGQCSRNTSCETLGGLRLLCRLSCLVTSWWPL